LMPGRGERHLGIVDHAGAAICLDQPLIAQQLGSSSEAPIRSSDWPRM
jgi:hypothetical protein